jgi:hypothetical protein
MLLEIIFSILLSIVVFCSIIVILKLYKYRNTIQENYMFIFEDIDFKKIKDKLPALPSLGTGFVGLVVLAMVIGAGLIVTSQVLESLDNNQTTANITNNPVDNIMDNNGTISFFSYDDMYSNINSICIFTIYRKRF